MAFEVEDYLDLLRLLTERPGWRAELRRLLLTDELLTLPQIVRELAEAQRRTEERMGRVEGHLDRVEENLAALAEAQRRTEERVGRVEGHLDRVEENLAALAEAQRRTEERVGRVEEQVQVLIEGQRGLIEGQKRLVDTVGDLKGRILERTYRGKATAYFGPLLQRLRVVDPYALEATLRAHLSTEEFNEVLLLDLLVCGQPRSRPEPLDGWLAVEISAVVDQSDVERARRRAALLRRAGYRTVPAVAGERATLGAEDEARHHQVVMLQDGRAFLWQEALRAWVAQ